jgi:transposase
LYRVHLADAQCAELERRAHDPRTKPRTRDRLEMVRLSHAGWSVPCIARHFRCHEETVRPWIKAFLARGFDALADQPHPGQQSQLTPAREEAIRAELRRDARTWTAAQLATWVTEQFGVGLSPAQLGRRLNRAGIGYKRVSRSLKHKQDPNAVAAAQKEIAAQEKRGARRARPGLPR